MCRKLIYFLLCVVSFRKTHSFIQERYDVDRMKSFNLGLEIPVDHLKRPLLFDEYIRCRYQICSHVENYPKEEIYEAMENVNSEAIKNLFGNLFNSTISDPGIGFRYDNDGVDFESRQLCLTKGPVTNRPRVMRNVNLKWKFIVNVDPYFQEFTSETCLEGQTFDDLQSFKVNDMPAISECLAMNFICTQDYENLNMLTFEDGRLEFDKFLVPTMCNCRRDCQPKEFN